MPVSDHSLQSFVVRVPVFPLLTVQCSRIDDAIIYRLLLKIMVACFDSSSLAYEAKDGKFDQRVTVQWWRVCMPASASLQTASEDHSVAAEAFSLSPIQFKKPGPKVFTVSKKQGMSP